ncbi:hypothetical protein ACIRYZ_45140 [Kitasatospora sp. NPDC101155]|uniref:hypothetical protein n=1 Tax=Kitasatospora sp. NPDC101155 TaxID=3364097 RepID=UPI003805A179
MRAREEERRRRLLDGVEAAYEILTDDMIEDRLDRPTAAVSHAPWVALLDGVLTVAGQAPYEIAFATRP